MEDLKHLVTKYSMGFVHLTVGLIFLMVALSTEQNILFIIGALAIVVTGVLSILSLAGKISKKLHNGLFAGLMIFAGYLAFENFNSIKDPIDFDNSKIHRSTFVIQRLKDIRTMEMAYKSVNGTYCNNFDSLLHFVKTDSFIVVKKQGDIPDSLVNKLGLEEAEREAWAMGIIKRDTLPVPVKDSIFSKRYMKNRKVSFVLDSLPYIPYSDNEKFNIASDIIEKGNTKVPVFEIYAMYPSIFGGLDSRFYKKSGKIKVGSLIDPSTSGNWE